MELTWSQGRWTAISSMDLAALDAGAADGVRSLTGGFEHAGSPQAAYYRPGTLAQARLIRRALRDIGSPMPTPCEAEKAWATVAESATHFGIESDKHGWEIRYLPALLDRPGFAEDPWALLFERESNWMEVGPFAGSLGTALSAIAALSRQTDLRELPGEARALLVALADAGLVSPGSGIGNVVPHGTVHLLGHAGFAVTHGENTLLVDPVFGPRTPTTPATWRTRQIDAILLTHHHWDHAHLQTLVSFSRQTPILIPEASKPTPLNPPIAPWLRELGFTDIREMPHWSTACFGEIHLTAAPLYGEHFGPEGAFDGITPAIRTPCVSIYASVDAGSNALEAMAEVVERISRDGPIDLALIGCSGQEHEELWAPCGVAGFSDALRRRPELRRYHPVPAEIVPWLRILRPAALVPYAVFDFEGEAATSTLDDLLASPPPDPTSGAPWAASVAAASDAAQTPLLWLQPGHSIL